MFCQNDVYVPDEYGTRECAEDREPCGAFYGIPFSGEVAELSLYDRQQIFDNMPTRWFSRRDERVLAKIRGEAVEDDEDEKQKREFVERVQKTDERDTRSCEYLTDRERDKIENGFINTYIEHREQFRGMYTISEYLKIRWKQYERSIQGGAIVL